MLYSHESNHIHVSVRPTYCHDYSLPKEKYFVWNYEVRIRNNGFEAMKLIHRHWQILDENGQERYVDGEGVIGKQPLLSPGKVFAYQSFTVLPTPRGEMKGYYDFVSREGSIIKVLIPIFQLEFPVRLVNQPAMTVTHSV